MIIFQTAISSCEMLKMQVGYDFYMKAIMHVEIHECIILRKIFSATSKNYAFTNIVHVSLVLR